jgi:hypothetical protein
MTAKTETALKLACGLTKKKAPLQGPFRRTHVPV